MSKLTRLAQDGLDRVFREYDRAILLFSGGKDSLVIYDLARPYKDRITAIWINTGASLPHMREFIKRYDVVEVKVDKAQQNAEYGFPADLVPVVNNPAIYEGETQYPSFQFPKLQDWRACCAMNRWRPMSEYIESSGAKLVIYGQRESDLSILGNEVEKKGVFWYSPIWKWSDKDVSKYLRANNIELPEQYPEAVSSFDCWDCTAIDSDPNWFYSRYKYLKKRYPDYAEILRGRLAAVAIGVDREIERIESTVGAIVMDIPGEFKPKDTVR